MATPVWNKLKNNSFIEQILDKAVKEKKNEREK